MPKASSSHALLQLMEDAKARHGQNLPAIMESSNAEYLKWFPDERAPFLRQDIVQAHFAHYLRETANAREQALVTTQALLMPVWGTWHIDVAVMGKSPTSQEIEELKLLMPALQQLGLTHLLMKGLSPDVAMQVQRVLLTREPELA